ncbi:hypothetical protein Nepgr_032830 [Nepenthes gracilis]|uniref:Uncharacterized protein n=1 Tax=Nepenthes gracilis TaxID=150966 RepID=A0AAD3Y631_NEPGR|nr:hypothetical protein Nepgr_032830 [Nepenthes gracilis]
MHQQFFEVFKNWTIAAAACIGIAFVYANLHLQRSSFSAFQVNEKKQTEKVGKHLHHLAKHPRRKIQSFATELIEISKNIIMEESKNKRTENLENKNSVKVEPANMESNNRKTNYVKVENVPRAETVKKEKIEEGISSRPEKREKTETVMVERKLDRVISPRPETIS